ncbi:MAG: sulfite exporter TauE/SafE family protein [Vicinamibacterales bacterium]
MLPNSVPLTPLVIFAAAFVGGALNAVAGGGSFITLPALLYAGVPPVSANATSAFALWPASIASVVAYRRELSGMRAWMARLGAISVIGGLIGGILLVRTSDESFMRLLPWLMLLAALTFTFGGRITQRLRRSPRRRGVAAAPPSESASSRSGAAAEPHPTAAPRSSASIAQPSAGTALGGVGVPLWVLVPQLVIATYGGYFGGGMGIMMLAAMAIAGMSDMHAMNGLKSGLAVAINGVAVATFIVDGTITWTPGFIMMAGGIVGGYAGAALARRTAGTRVRSLVLAIAWTMTTYFFLR